MYKRQAHEHLRYLSPAGVSVQLPVTKVVIADATATWVSNVTLMVAGTTPSNRTMALPRDILLLAELDVNVSTDLGRLAELQPGLIAEVGSFLQIVLPGGASEAQRSLDPAVVAFVGLSPCPIIPLRLSCGNMLCYGALQPQGLSLIHI